MVVNLKTGFHFEFSAEVAGAQALLSAAPNIYIATLVQDHEYNKSFPPAYFDCPDLFQHFRFCAIAANWHFRWSR